MVTILASRIRALMGWDSENGQALVEYSLIMCLVAVSYTHLTLPTICSV